MKKLGLLMAGLMILNVLTVPVFAEDVSSSVGANEGEKVTVDGDKVAIEQHLSDEAKRAEKKRRKHAKKAGKKVSRQERKAARQIRKDQRIKEKAQAKQEAKLERKKKEWEWKHQRHS